MLHLESADAVASRVREGEIAIPEIQRPFVWDSSQVRDLLDSLYQGFPIGYLIDGQQRVTALTAAILGQPVVHKSYKRARIVIGFNPLEKRFEVANPAILKDPAWIHDVAPLLSGELKLIKAVGQYLAANPTADSDAVEDTFSNLTNIAREEINIKIGKRPPATISRRFERNVTAASSVSF
jgi:hypothetical protein